MKRTLAFLTVSHGGIFLVAVGLLRGDGLGGASIYMVADGLLKGALMKTATREELVGAIRAIGYQGKTFLSVSQRSAREIARPARANPLSPRESQILELAAKALSNAQIATLLFISEGTVKRHLTNIYAKLGAVSRLDAVNRARAGGLIQPAVEGGELPPPAE